MIAQQRYPSLGPECRHDEIGSACPSHIDPRLRGRHPAKPQNGKRSRCAIELMMVSSIIRSSRQASIAGPRVRQGARTARTFDFTQRARRRSRPAFAPASGANRTPQNDSAAHISKRSPRPVASSKPPRPNPGWPSSPHLWASVRFTFIAPSNQQPASPRRPTRQRTGKNARVAHSLQTQQSPTPSMMPVTDRARGFTRTQRTYSA